jgi:hypothetical protein
MDGFSVCSISLQVGVVLAFCQGECGDVSPWRRYRLRMFTEGRGTRGMTTRNLKRAFTKSTLKCSFKRSVVGADVTSTLRTLLPFVRPAAPEI